MTAAETAVRRLLDLAMTPERLAQRKKMERYNRTAAYRQSISKYRSTEQYRQKKNAAARRRQHEIKAASAAEAAAASIRDARGLCVATGATRRELLLAALAQVSQAHTHLEAALRDA